MSRTIANTTIDERRVTAITDKIPSNPDRVLDVGCVRHNRARRAYGNLHAQLHVDYPDSDIVGIDIDSPETKRMQSPGYDIREVDAEEMYLEGEFDAIVCGEVLEHLARPGAFLRRAAKHLSKDGRIIVSTPNPSCITYFARHAVGNWTSPDHTCWIDPKQLETLVGRSADWLSVSEYEYLKPEGTVSNVLYEMGREQIGAGTYVAVIA